MREPALQPAKEQPDRGAIEIHPGPPSWLRLAVQFISLSALGALLFVFHGISLHLTPWSQAIINGIVKYQYPIDGQGDATVVLFREQNLRDLNESYPVSYERHAEVLEALASYRPRAVFVDFAFIDRRSAKDIERLSEGLCALRDADTPAYLALPAAAAEGESSAAIDAALRKCAKLVSAQMDSEQGVSGVLTYRNGSVATPDSFVPTPAFALAEKADGWAKRQKPLEIIWGNGVAPLNKKWMDCEAHDPFSHLVAVLRHNPLAEKLKCPYSRTITVGHLLNSSGDKDIADAVTGKTVFYGAAFHLTGDRVISPVYDELPGVYLHAMAYDNLVTFGQNYKRADRDVLSLSGLVNGVLLVLVVAILLFVDTPRTLAMSRSALERLTISAKWLVPALAGLVVSLVTLAVFVPAALSAVFYAVPLLLAAIALLHLASAHGADARSPRHFVGERAVAASILGAGGALFLLVDRGLGLDAALLFVVLPAYFLYKVLVKKDGLFVATAVLLVAASLLAFLPPINLGPRNIIAYVAFFELARHLIRHADETAREYFALRTANRSADGWGLNGPRLRALDWLFALFLRSDTRERNV